MSPHNGAVKSVQTIDRVNSLRSAIHDLRREGKRIALVPTMGALHAGHLALITEAKRHADAVVVSIFVNPKQFGPNEDFDAYPRPAEADVQKLLAAGIDILWMPSVPEVYPAGFATTIAVSGLPDRLCGAARPGHFDGVTTIVAKLFNQVQPDCAIFGEKDWQQLAIIRRMVVDLNLPLEIIGLTTQRAADGLALSSRNAYLSEVDRVRALALPAALRTAKLRLEAGKNADQILAAARQEILSGGFSSIDYVEFVDAQSLEPLKNANAVGRVLAAAKIGKTRLIDNFPVSVAS